MQKVESADRLDGEELRAALGDQKIGHKIVVVEETGSTNDIVWEMAAAGAEEGLVVFAERQSAGRGQYGRSWESAPFKGLWFSILLRPKIALIDSPRLSALLAEVVAKALIEECACEATIKQPNDVYISSRKVAGALIEGRNTAEGNYVAVAGIGVNVNHTLADFPEELRATAGSLAMAAGHSFVRAELAVALLRRLNSVRFDLPPP